MVYAEECDSADTRKKTTGDVIEFEKPSTVMIHAEGEYQELKDVKKIEIRKSEKPLKVVKF